MEVQDNNGTKETIIELFEKVGQWNNVNLLNLSTESENHTLNISDELKKKLETEEIIIRHDDRHTYDSF